MFPLPPDRLGSRKAANFTAWLRRDPAYVVRDTLPCLPPSGGEPSLPSAWPLPRHGKRVNRRSSTGGTGQPEEVCERGRGGLPGATHQGCGQWGGMRAAGRLL